MKMNHVVLVGRLTKDPELRYTQTGVAVSTFTLAVDKFNGKDKEADFINIVVWNAPAENCAKYLSKGKQAAIQGRIQTRNYEGSDGKKVYVTEIVANEVKFLQSADKQGGGLLAGSQSFESDLPFES